MNYIDSIEYMKFLKNLNVDILAGLMAESTEFYTNKGITNDIYRIGIQKSHSEYFDDVVSPLNLTYTDKREKELLLVSCSSAIFSYLYLKKCINIDYEYFECPYVNYWRIAKNITNFCNNYCMAMNYLFKNVFDLDLCLSYTLERTILELTNTNNKNVKMSTVVEYPNFHICKRSELSPEEVFIYMS